MRRLSENEYEQELIRAAEALGQAKAEKEQVQEQIVRHAEFAKRFGGWQPRSEA
ncbi:hypothetical protein KBX03_07625 [Micromonospora sp. C72]|uniref:hypothetical protein n=1 Tax=Micromonospora sp. C72 TaxID=2824880 RepID=UPI001B3806D0|nr:hypothetical protein [Micromonospora sp. C72]MBQ1042373.1 hypothetical protein [Micromonospora sp. C72]